MSGVKPISPAASRVLRAIIALEARHKRGVGWQELADEIGRGLGTVQDHVHALIAADYVAKADGYFGIRAKRTPDGSLVDQLPAVGRVSAGPPALAVEERGVDPVAELRARHPDARPIVLDMPIRERGLKVGDVLFVEDREPVGREWKYEDAAVVAAWLWVSR